MLFAFISLRIGMTSSYSHYWPQMTRMVTLMLVTSPQSVLCLILPCMSVTADCSALWRKLALFVKLSTHLPDYMKDFNFKGILLSLCS